MDESTLSELIPRCLFTTTSYPKSFIEECNKVEKALLVYWANKRCFVEYDAGGLCARFPNNDPTDFRRIRIEKLLEEPFNTDGTLKEEYKSKVYKPILLADPDADGNRVMRLDNDLRVKYYPQHFFPEWAAPLSDVK